MKWTSAALPSNVSFLLDPTNALSVFSDFQVAAAAVAGFARRLFQASVAAPRIPFGMKMMNSTSISP
jgi:hypothetical protein